MNIFSFDNRAQNSLSFFIYFQTGHLTTFQILAICRAIVIYKQCVFWRINESCKVLRSNFQIVKSEGQRFEASSEVDIILSPTLNTSKYDRYFFHSLLLYFKLFFYVIQSILAYLIPCNGSLLTNSVLTLIPVKM